MSKHYIYNCLIKNDVNLLGLATLLSVIHHLFFYKQESVFSMVIISIAALISAITLGLSIRMKAVLNLRTTVASLILGSVILSIFTAIQHQTNDISGFFITMLGMVIIVFGIFNIKEMIYMKKIAELPDTKSDGEYSSADVVAFYRHKLYEVIRYDLDNKINQKYSLFFDYRINMAVSNYELTDLEKGQTYSLRDFLNYCKEHDMNLLKTSKEDFEVYKMMII